MKTRALFGTVVLALGVASAAAGDTTTTLNTEVTRMDTLAGSQGQSHVIGKISGDFNGFLGSDSTAVVTGLRNGTPITLTTTSPGPTPASDPVVTTTVITPPTGKMGFGNVYTSLALAKQQLGQLGITQPTPEQLQAALTGGTIVTGTGPTATTTTLEGILTMRSQNMGWGQIAQKLGFKLGPVISSMRSANQKLATTTTVGATKATASTKMTTTGSAKTGGVTTASGKAHGKAGSGIVSASGSAHGNSSALHGNKSSGQGIVTASGRAGGGHAHGLGRGIVTGSGSGASGGVVSASGRGHGSRAGHGKGHNK